MHQTEPRKLPVPGGRPIGRHNRRMTSHHACRWRNCGDDDVVKCQAFNCSEPLLRPLPPIVVIVQAIG
jgi:hypothetical protein